MPVSAQTVNGEWRETAGPPATPLPPGIASVLSVLSSSAVVLDAEDRVLQASDAARSFGLVEGVWPPAPEPGPWLSRPMRATVGLPSPLPVWTITSRRKSLLR